MKRSFASIEGLLRGHPIFARPSRAAVIAGLVTLTFAMNASARDISASSPEPAPAEVAGEIVKAFDALFSGPHPGARAIHTKGLLLKGTFAPSEEIAKLSRAEHFAGPKVPVLVRFSNFAGLPAGNDGDPTSNPRGMSIKFQLSDGGETDIVAHSYNGFPAGTPDDFLGFLRALAAPDPSTITEFLSTHPAAQAFADAPKPAPESYATEFYFGVDAFRFTNTAGISRYGRYRIEPVAGGAWLSDTEASGRSRDYLADEMALRLARAPAQFRLMIQLAGPDDVVTDGSVAWPDDRPTVNAGTLTLTSFVPDGDAMQRSLFFTPLNLVAGIAPSADPLLIARTRAYRISYKRRTAHHHANTGETHVEASN